MVELLKLVRVDSRLKAEQTFPYSMGRVVVEPATSKQEFYSNYIPMVAVEELNKNSKSWKFYIKKEQFKVYEDQTRKETEAEAEKREKSEKRITARNAAVRQESLKVEAQPPVTSEEVETAIEAGKEILQLESNSLVESLSKTLTEKKETFETEIEELKTSALASVEELITKKINPSFEGLKTASTSFEEQKEELQTLKGDVVELFSEVETKINELTSELTKTLDKFRKDADKISKAHLEALKKAVK